MNGFSESILGALYRHFVHTQNKPIYLEQLVFAIIPYMKCSLDGISAQALKLCISDVLLRCHFFFEYNEYTQQWRMIWNGDWSDQNSTLYRCDENARVNEDGRNVRQKVAN